jgi:hypothetical protein
VLAAAGLENAGEHGWGARVDQKSAETCISSFQNQKKNSEKTGQKILSTTIWLSYFPKEDILRLTILPK